MRVQYEKTVKMEKEVHNLKRTTEEIRQLLHNRTEVLQKLDGLPDLPLRTFADAERAEDLANNTIAVKKFIVSIPYTCGGHP